MNIKLPFIYETMTQELWILALTTASIGFLHTLTGPDHYLPFIVIGKARNWTKRKTIGLTFLCGMGHVMSSVIIGIVGIGTGVLMQKIQIFEGYRGSIAAWALILFGIGYMIWGAIKLYKNRPHAHIHMHTDGSVHVHKHTHQEEHTHKHNISITPWILFTVFVLGPCEPLIPMMMYPAAKAGTGGVVFITMVFSFFTIGTMMGIVYLTCKGMDFIPLKKFEKYMHVTAGATIMLSGLAIEVLSL